MTVHTRRVEDELGRSRLVFYARTKDDDTTEWIDVRKDHVVRPRRML
jgi:hypothetical protein